MKVQISKNAKAHLDDVYDFKGFKVVAKQNLTEKALSAAIAEVGELRSGSAWISEQWLRSRGPNADPDWDRQFEAMIAFARTKGWFDEISRRIRAHVEYV